jgi:ADP-dependent phosphofructokinase/glucokinase
MLLEKLKKLNKKEIKMENFGHKRLGKIGMEYDGSIVMGNQVVGTIAPDYFTHEEVCDVSKELVKRWNTFETIKNDLIELCEDNEVMKQVIIEYFEHTH